MAKKKRNTATLTAPAPVQVNQQQQVRRRERRSLVNLPVEKELVESILGLLPYNKLDDPDPLPRTLFEKYADSLAVIERCLQDLLNVTKVLFNTNLTYDPPQPVIVRNYVENALAAEISISLSPPPNIATAELGSMPKDHVRDRLSRALAQVSQKLIEQFFDGLDLLLEKEKLGFSHWPGETAVNYRFYRTVVRARDAIVHRTATQVVAPKNDRGPDWTVTQTLHREIKAIPLDISVEHHTHDAIDAFTTTIEESKVVMPREVEALIKAIPDWMRPSIRIIDGYLIRERVEEKKRRSETVVTEVTESVETTYQQRVKPRPFNPYSHGFEPAVMLGTIVLTGWGPREIEATLKERELDANDQKLRKSAELWTSLSVAAQAAMTMRVLERDSLVFEHPIAFMTVALISACCFAKGIKKYAQRTSTQVDALVLLLTAISFGSFFFGLQCILDATRGKEFLAGVMFVATSLCGAKLVTPFIRRIFFGGGSARG